MAIEWRDDYATGNQEVDFEHRELIRLINEALERISEAGEGADVADYLGEVFVRIAGHFALEEKVMRKHQYDEYKAHKVDHEKLLDAIRDIMDDCSDGGTFNEDELSRTLSDWFSGHFRSFDVRLHSRLGGH